LRYVKVTVFNWNLRVLLSITLQLLRSCQQSGLHCTSLHNACQGQTRLCFIETRLPMSVMFSDIGTLNLCNIFPFKHRGTLLSC